ncbi:hypothetical protein HZA43_02855 [Candidatus Peregrinibacteria bacterium]|nr:hypothetical protein [Candidatus Peregrinibacteria bacterium]
MPNTAFDLEYHDDVPEEPGQGGVRERVAAALRVVSPLASEVFNNLDVTAADLRAGLDAVAKQDETPDLSKGASQREVALGILSRVTDGAPDERAALIREILADERLGRRVAAKVRALKGMKRPKAPAPEKAKVVPAAPSAPRVMAMLLTVPNEKHRASLARKALEVIGRDIASLRSPVEVLLAQDNILGDAEKLARAIRTPELRTAFVAHFESARDSEATERKEADLKALRDSDLPTSKLRHYLKLLRDKGFKGRPVAVAANAVLNQAPAPRAEGGRSKLIELIGGHPDLLRVVAEYVEEESGKAREAAPKLRSATRMELEAHLIKVGKDAEKQVRGVLRRMAEGSVFSDVRGEAAQLVADLGGNVYEVKFSVILFALESYPHVCAALISIIKPAEKNPASAASIPKAGS